MRDNTLHSLWINGRTATDKKSVEVGSQVCEGRKDSAGEATASPHVQVFQPRQAREDLHQAEVRDAGGGQTEVDEAGDDLGELDQALLTHQSSPAVREMELAQVNTLQAVTQGQTGDGASTEVEISQLHQLANTTPTESHTLLVMLHQLHSETLSLSLQDHFYLSSEEEEIINIQIIFKLILP